MILLCNYADETAVVTHTKFLLVNPQKEFQTKFTKCPGTNLVRLVEDDERPFELWPGSVLKVFHVLRDYLPVADQIAL